MILICKYNQYVKEKMYKCVQSVSSLSTTIENKFILKSEMSYIRQHQLVTHIIHYMHISMPNNIGLTAIPHLYNT